MNVHTITLELLRHGPAHNQLLSPLTRYLALCGNHSTATVTVPFEHDQFLTRLRALRYKETQQTRELQLRDTARQMAAILAEVPGLIAELAERPAEETKLTHLELVLSSSELALLPFEAADAPDGFPGAGQPLVLQAQLPLCITRRVRRVSNLRFQWPSRPRILFAAAAPPGVGSIPLESHLLALRRAVDPWVRFYAKDDEEGRKKAVERRLVFLPRASVKSLEEACRQHAITHVHFLAHGAELEQAGNRRFGLALHDSHDPSRTDRVDGTRLAAALRTCLDQPHGDLAMPAVVSIAACDSGGVGSVIGAGASVAHAVHEAGVPLVVASQFPLSFAGSVIMVEGLYKRLLWGADPRRALNCLRRELRSRIADTHDWASLVAYAAFPPDLEAQVARERRERVKDSIGVALDRADGFLNHQDSADGDG
ncbi:MAG: CHAT domain-containing protein, partial [bacterium]|nr:CHAT domain-containing protein [bacterium]